LEVYDPFGARVYQQTWDNQGFATNQTRSFVATYALPLTSPPGSYTLRVSVFGPGGAPKYHSNQEAGSFTVL
jgi:hypothetical protein